MLLLQQLLLLQGGCSAYSSHYHRVRAPTLARRTAPVRAIAGPLIREDDEPVAGAQSPNGFDTAPSTGLLAPGPLRPLRVLWRFSRPHTIIGSALCIPALTAFAAPTAASLMSVPLWLGALYAVVPALLMNVYIVGLNQLFDVDIDKVRRRTRIALGPAASARPDATHRSPLSPPSLLR